MRPMAERDYDLVFYGASGFTGKQAVKYFAQHAQELRWAIAGRNREKLEAMRAQIGAPASTAAVLVAESGDQAAVDAIVSRTRVMLSTAGPFALYGSPVVDACVRFKTHYVDISGETGWVRELIDRYHQRAALEGTRIIPFCGFDSVPSDLGTYLLVRHMRRELGVPCKEAKAFFQLYGGFNGGTVASSFNTHESTRPGELSHPFLLNPEGARTEYEIERSQDPTRPRYDADIGTWVAPFLMGPINTRVVRRSAALYAQCGEPYGSEFVYQEYQRFNRPFARIKAAAATAGIAVFESAMWRPSIRRLLKPLLPVPGSGPSENTMANGWFRCQLLGLSDDGRRVSALICDRGDPGNRVTVKCLCESALSLLSNTDALPGGYERGGVLTPATGLGEVLVERLREAGMIIEINNA